MYIWQVYILTKMQSLCTRFIYNIHSYIHLISSLLFTSSSVTILFSFKSSIRRHHENVLAILSLHVPAPLPTGGFTSLYSSRRTPMLQLFLLYFRTVRINNAVLTYRKYDSAHKQGLKPRLPNLDAGFSPYLL